MDLTSDRASTSVPLERYVYGPTRFSGACDVDTFFQVRTS